MKQIIIWITTATLLTGAIGGAYWYVSNLQIENERLTANNEILTITNESNINALNKQTEDYNKLSELNKELEQSLQDATEYNKQLITTLSKHDLEYLAIEKPVLIIRRINKGTDKILDEFKGE